MAELLANLFSCAFYVGGGLYGVGDIVEVVSLTGMASFTYIHTSHP